MYNTYTVLIFKHSKRYSINMYEILIRTKKGIHFFMNFLQFTFLKKRSRAYTTSYYWVFLRLFLQNYILHNNINIISMHVCIYNLHSISSIHFQSILVFYSLGPKFTSYDSYSLPQLHVSNFVFFFVLIIPKKKFCSS